MDYNINAKRVPVNEAGETSSPAQATPNPARQPEPEPRATAPSSGGSLLGNLIQKEAESASASNAAFRSLSTLKTVGAVLGGLVHHTRRMTPEQINKASQQAIQHYGEQSMKLHKLLGTPTERYVLESITGSVSSLISEHFRVAGPSALEVDWATKMYEGCQVEGVYEFPKGKQDWASPEAKRTLATMDAVWPIISAIQKHNLFHDDTKALTQRFTDKLWMMVDETLEENGVVQKMGDNEKEMIRKNLLLRSGQLLGDVWLTNIREALLEIREMGTDERRHIVANGYPLDKIDQEFNEQYALLERSFVISLNINYDSDQTVNQNTAPTLT